MEFNNAWQVLKVALLVPVLGREIHLSSRNGSWERVRSILVSLKPEGRPNEGFLKQPHLAI